jgi:hypothetical protein
MDLERYNAISDTIALTVGNPAVDNQYGALKSLWPRNSTQEIYPRLSMCSTSQADDCLVWVRENEEGVVEAVDPKFLFTRVGTYNVCIAVDSYVAEPLENFPRGEVSETLDGAEDNNFTCEEIPVSDPPVPPLFVYLPLVAQ